jgi:hypothetical protein
MSPEPIEYSYAPLLVPPSYEQSVAEPIGLRADYVVSPLAMAELFAWDEEEDD